MAGVTVVSFKDVAEAFIAEIQTVVKRVESIIMRRQRIGRWNEGWGVKLEIVTVGVIFWSCWGEPN